MLFQTDSDSDLKKEYAHRLLWRGLNDLARADAVSENDGTRMIRHWKFDLMEFYEKHHPKNRTVDIRGGGHNNMPKDLYNEFLNKE